MLQFFLCLFGLHGATEINYTVDDEEIKVCRDCLKEVREAMSFGDICCKYFDISHPSNLI